MWSHLSNDREDEIDTWIEMLEEHLGKRELQV